MQVCYTCLYLVLKSIRYSSIYKYGTIFCTLMCLDVFAFNIGVWVFYISSCIQTYTYAYFQIPITCQMSYHCICSLAGGHNKSYRTFYETGLLVLLSSHNQLGWQVFNSSVQKHPGIMGSKWFIPAHSFWSVWTGLHVDYFVYRVSAFTQ